MSYRDFYRAKEYGSDDDEDSDDSGSSWDEEAHSDGEWKGTKGKR